MNTPVSVTKTHKTPETPEENIYHSASIANKYATDLMSEMEPLIDQMEINHPKEAARFTSLISELVLITGITKNRAEKLLVPKPSIILNKNTLTINYKIEE